MLRRFPAHFTPYKVATAPNFKIKLDKPCISTSVQKGTSTLPHNRRREIFFLLLRAYRKWVSKIWRIS